MEKVSRNKNLKLEERTDINTPTKSVKTFNRAFWLSKV